jgi:hypothetical protein
VNRLSTRSGRPASSQRRSVRPGLEVLEDRLVLSVSYHGGALLTNVSVQPVYYGSDWNTPVFSQQAAQLTGFLNFYTNSSYMDMLSEYNVGRGSLANGGVVDPGIHAGQTVDATTIQQMLVRDINQGLLAAPNANRLYVVYTNPNVLVTFLGGNSQQDFEAFHDAFVDASGRVIYYAVMPHPMGNGDVAGLNDFQTLTLYTSHEVAEGVTDPTALTGIDAGGWYGRFRGFPGDQEIADVTSDPSDLISLNGYVVQTVWSQRLGTLVTPQGAVPFGGQPPGVLAPPTLSQVANLFTHGTEYFANLIEADYQHYLGRTPTPGEVRGWVAALQNGLRDEQVVAAFLGSPEYYAHAGGTDPAWVDAIYHDLLGRAADPAGEAAWLTSLAAGTGRGAIAYGFATSTEAEGLVVQSDYQTYLGRSATAGEVSVLVNALQSGITNEQVIAGFVSSPEYFESATKGNGDQKTWIRSLYSDVLNRSPSTAEVDLWYNYLNS